MEFVGFSGVLPSIEHPASKTLPVCHYSKAVMSAKGPTLSVLMVRHIAVGVGELWVGVGGLTLYSVPFLERGVDSRLGGFRFRASSIQPQWWSGSADPGLHDQP